MRRPIRLALTMSAGLTLLGSAVAGTALAGTTPAAARPADARQAILAAFDRYQVVGGMSPAHGVKDVDDFLLDLIRDPDLPGKVNDIAVECGNSYYQPILDRYIAGDDVPAAEIQQVWRNTTQPNCGFSTFYEQLFPLVRRINEKLPPAKKLRVLACDPPVDWTKVHSQDDFLPFTERDTTIASVMEKQVLARHRKALMLFGLAHTLHTSGAVAIYEQKYPNTTFVIADHLGFAKDNDVLEKRMAAWPTPSLTPVKGTWLDKLDSSYFSGFPGEWGSAAVDAYLYLGPRSLLIHQPLSAKAILDEDYITELDRRADTIGIPPNDPMRPAGILQSESAASVLFYSPE